MPKERNKQNKASKLLSIESLRHAEYYDMQETFDELYAKSKAGEKFTDLMGLILKRENILLAYRNIKGNSGSCTPGTDKLTIDDIGRLTPDEVVERVRAIIKGSKDWGYRPRPVRRKEIPKPNGSTRPLGIPCIWDRLIQQCIKQVMEPICEAQFSENSHGFRPQRSAEHAVAAAERLMQRNNLHYCIEFDIKGFFDNVDHPKLMKQLWAMGIQDKHLLWVIKRILKAPIRLPDGKTMYPEKGTPQGGIISPLLANVVLNELDHWVESQWQNNPVTRKYSIRMNQHGSEIKSVGYTAMRKTKLKEMKIVRYADDFRIFCRAKTDAEKTLIAVTQWLKERLRLEVSPEKTRIINVKRRYSEFLGFKIKVHPKGKKYVVKSHISDKKMKQERQKLIEQAKKIAKPNQRRTKREEISLYNSMVTGIQNYFCYATCVNLDCAALNRAVMTVFTNRLRVHKGKRLVRTGRALTKTEKGKYGKSAMLRYVAGSDEPIYPIGYVQHKSPLEKKRSICCYTAEGREGVHDNLRVNTALMLAMMRKPLYGWSAEYADNRISLFSAQWGRCAVTGKEFLTLSDIHCHHKIPRSKGGSDAYSNLCLVLKPVHVLVHATDEDTINQYMNLLKLNKGQLAKLNKLRVQAGNAEILVQMEKSKSAEETAK